MTKTKRRIGNAAYAVLILFALYWCVALAVFAHRHPWMTDTERLQRLGDALLWRDVDRPIDR